MTAAEGTTGSPLRQRMIDQMRIANFAASTQTTYIGEIEEPAKHYRASPADLDADHLRVWVLHGIERTAGDGIETTVDSYYLFDYRRLPSW